MAKRALTIQNILDKKYTLLEFDGAWRDAFMCPERAGTWFVWGNSGNGKTTFVLQMIKYLAGFEKVLFDSLEEGVQHTLQKSLETLGMIEVGRRVEVVCEGYNELIDRLTTKKSPNIIVIDSIQWMQISYQEFKSLRDRFPKKLFVFISQADGKLPSSKPATDIMYASTLKIWVEGYRAFSKGRYIGPIGHIDIWPEKAASIWGIK